MRHPAYVADAAGVLALWRAIEAAPAQVGRVVDLAKFLSKQGRIEESERTFQEAEKLAPNNPRLLYQRAEAYIKAGRNLGTARELLRKYMASTNLSPDDPSRYDAEKLLQKAGS
jgi:cytochrome c-type biogenesis protein CcmH/NrfG